MIGLFGGPAHNAEVGHVRKVSGLLFYSNSSLELKEYKDTLFFFFHILVTFTFLFSDVLHTVNMKSMKKVRREGYICNSRSSKYTRS